MPKSILQDPLLLSQLKWSEIEDLLCLEVFGQNRRDPLSVHGLVNIDTVDSGVFRTAFRFEKDDIRRLQRALLIPDALTTPQRVTVPGDEALCITLRRLAYPNRLRDLEDVFWRQSSTLSSVTNTILQHLEEKFSHLLDDVNNHFWLNIDTLERFSQAIHAKGAPLRNCWGFIDDTARPICRPSQEQKIYFRGHKRVHALKYQAIMCPNGIICQLDGSYPGSKHDAGNFGKSDVYTKLTSLVKGQSYCIYGDPAYPLRPLLMKPYGSAHITPQQKAFNKAMSTVRQAVEWGFGKIVGLFAFCDFKKNQKICRQNVPRIFKGSALLANCHTCLYSAQVSQYFGVDPPSLEVYLAPR
ncbi:hypothetical protein V5799_018485 [Amblyomma americanum]|uniref:DDE Tnp4 domain-containing protein n=1 Tax=Amblyomma americanum TaxID=6943 RepID=A0AAQ4EZC0_AMBAM